MCVCDCVCVCACVCVCTCVCVHSCNKETQSPHTGNRHIYSYMCTHCSLPSMYAMYLCLYVHLLLHMRKINTFPHAKETPAHYLLLLPPLPSSVYVRMYRCGHGCFAGIGTRSQVFMYISQDLLKLIDIQWDLSLKDTTGIHLAVLYREVSLIQR